MLFVRRVQFTDAQETARVSATAHPLWLTAHAKNGGLLRVTTTTTTTITMTTAGALYAAPTAAAAAAAATATILWPLYITNCDS